MVEEQPGQAPEKKPFLSEGVKRILKAIYLVLMIGYAAYSVYCAIAAYTKFDKITGQFYSLISNWQTDMIASVTRVAPGTSCPSNFTDLLSYQWPGTVDGCNCKYITQTTPPGTNITIVKQIYRQTCNSSMLAVQCTIISATPAVTMNTWNSNRYCVQRITGTSFVKMAPFMNSDGSCQSGYKKCGGLTDPINAICVNAASFGGGCPVMDIANNKVNANYTQVGSSVFYTTSTDYFNLSSMSQIYINEGGICASNIGTTTTTGSNHPLMATNIPTCSSFESTFSSFDTSIDRVTFFSNNGVTVTAVDELNQYVLSSQMITPYKRNYFGFSPLCRTDVLTMSDSLTYVKSIHGSQVALLAVAIIVGFFLGVLYIIFQLALMFKCCSEECRNKMQCCLNAQVWVDPLFKLLHIIFLIWAVAVSSKVKGYFTDLSTKNCGDSSTNSNLLNLSDQINTYVYKQDLNSLIVTAVMVFINIITVLYHCCCGKKKDDKAQIQNSNAASPAGP